MSMKDFYDSFKDRCVPSGTVCFNWSMKGMGFGELSFYTDEDGKVKCENECMSKETVKEILNIMVDQAEFRDAVD